MLTMQGTWVQSLVGELRSYMPAARPKKNKRERDPLTLFWKIKCKKKLELSLSYGGRIPLSWTFLATLGGVGMIG